MRTIIPASGYEAKVIESVKHRPGTWNTLKVGIFKDGEQIGEYDRNYSSLYRTFCPFSLDGKEYALYSRDYTSTRVMSLPDCKDLGGEERDNWGFCPVDYHVPLTATFKIGCNRKEGPYDFPHNDYGSEVIETLEEMEKDGPGGYYQLISGPTHLPFGFVAGCVWGDDCSWKIQYLDLSRVAEGIVTRDSRFGYIHMPGKAKTLEECIQVIHPRCVKITVDREFNPENGKDWDGPDDADEDE